MYVPVIKILTVATGIYLYMYLYFKNLSIILLTFGKG